MKKKTTAVPAGLLDMQVTKAKPEQINLEQAINKLLADIYDHDLQSVVIIAAYKDHVTQQFSGFINTPQQQAMLVMQLELVKTELINGLLPETKVFGARKA